MRKHDGMTYEIIPIEVTTATRGEHEEYKTGYEYTIFDVYADNEPHHSDEWYDTESEAVIAAEDKIDTLHDGDVEPDYDVQPYGQIDWDERRRMGE